MSITKRQVFYKVRKISYIPIVGFLHTYYNYQDDWMYCFHASGGTKKNIKFSVHACFLLLWFSFFPDPDSNVFSTKKNTKRIL